MKKNTLFMAGMWALTLTFGLVLAACASGPNPFSQLFGTSGTANGPGTNEFRTRYNDDRNLIIVKYLGRSEAVVIPAKIEDIPVVGIGAESFSGNRTIKSVAIPDSVVIIEKDAFDDCVGLTDLAIPASIIRIGENGNDAEDAFDGCTGLTGITVAEANGVYSSEDGVLFNKDKTALLLCPEGKSGSYTIPPSVAGVVDRAFESCAKLTNLTIPDNVTSIGERSFMNCAGLTSITIPGSIKSITGDMRDGYGYGAFLGCAGLSSATISEGVTSIGATAFLGCKGMTSVAIPGSVTSIGDQAFAECASLTSIVIPEGVTSIGEMAFVNCTGLTSASIPGSVKTITGDVRGNNSYGVFWGCTGLTSVTIAEGVTSIGATAFQRCSGLTSITIPNSVTSIGQQAFSSCSGLTSVVIPDSVTSIGANAFQSCSELTSVTISPVAGRRWDDLGIGADAFAGCYKLSPAARESLRRAGYVF